MRRYAFNLAAALSLLLCVAVCVLWARNFFIADSAAWRTADHVLAYDAAGNVMRFMSYDDADGLPPGWSGASTPATLMAKGLLDELEWFGGGLPSRFGFHVMRSRTDPAHGWKAGGRAVHAVYVPHGFVVLLTAALPAVWLKRRWLPWRRRCRGLCPACGYDLRASPGRCPECGRAADTPAAARVPSV